MAKGNNKKNGAGDSASKKTDRDHKLHPDARKSIWAIALFVIAVILLLAFWSKAGPVGAGLYNGLVALLGWGYLILPAALIFISAIFLLAEKHNRAEFTLSGAGLLVLSTLGIIDIFAPGHGGWLGLVLGSLKYLFGTIAATIIDGALAIVSIIVALNVPITIKRTKKERDAVFL